MNQSSISVIFCNLEAMENLNVTLIQTELAWENATENRAHFSDKIGQIDGQTDLILLPEMFTTGFSMTPENIAENPNDKTLKWLQEKAKETQAAISGSLIVKEHGKYYNRLYFVFPNGEYRTYDKRHLFSFAGEDEHYTAGKDLLTVEYKGWKICPLVCYDLRFPVWSRNTATYDLAFYIANWPQSRIDQWDTLLKARSIENIAYTIGLNRVGQDPNNNLYNGHSAVYAPLGKQLDTPGWEEDRLLHFNLSKKYLTEIRAQFRFLDDRDPFKIEK